MYQSWTLSRTERYNVENQRYEKGSDDPKKSAKRYELDIKEHPLTEAAISIHTAGGRSIGVSHVYTGDHNRSYTQIGIIDLDDGWNTSSHDDYALVLRICKEINLPFAVFQGGSRGFHIYFVNKNPIALRTMDKHMADILAVFDHHGGPDRKAEHFPRTKGCTNVVCLPFHGERRRLLAYAPNSNGQEFAIDGSNNPNSGIWRGLPDSLRNRFFEFLHRDFSLAFGATGPKGYDRRIDTRPAKAGTGRNNWLYGLAKSAAGRFAKYEGDFHQCMMHENECCEIPMDRGRATATAKSAWEKRQDRTSVEAKALSMPWAVVNVAGKIKCTDLSLPELDFFSKDDFKLLHANKLVKDEDKIVPLVDVWLRTPERPTYHGITCTAGDPGTMINYYRPMPEERRTGDVGPFQTLLDDLCSEETPNGFTVRPVERKFLEWWLAHLVQNPAGPRDKVPTAIVLFGAGGQGKGVLAEAMRLVLGDHNIAYVASDGFNRDFNYQWLGKPLLIAEEAHFAPNGQEQARLKNLIADSRISFNKKYLTEFSAPNVSRVMLFTNSTHAAAADVGDRRMCFIEVIHRHERPPTPTPPDHPTIVHFDKLRAWIKDHAPEIRNYLLNVKVDESFIEYAPMNAEAQEQQEINDPVLYVIKGYIEQGSLFGDTKGTGRTPSLYIHNDVRAVQPSYRGAQKLVVAQVRKLLGDVNARLVTGCPLYSIDGQPQSPVRGIEFAAPPDLAFYLKQKYHLDVVPGAESWKAWADAFAETTF